MARQRKKKPLHNPKAVKLAVPARPAPISRLPDEVLGLIYRHLGPGDRQAMRSTCKAWRESSAIAAQIDTLVFGADSYERHAQYIERIASFPPKSCLRSLSLVMAPKFFETLMKPGEAAAKARRNLETVEELELGLIWVSMSSMHKQALGAWCLGLSDFQTFQLSSTVARLKKQQACTQRTAARTRGQARSAVHGAGDLANVNGP